MGLSEEGIPQAREASEISERLDCTTEQGGFLITLALLLHSDEQLNAAKETVYRAVDLCAGGDSQFLVCQLHRVLGTSYKSGSDVGKAFYHFDVALRIAFSFNWHNVLSFLQMELMALFRECSARVLIERAKS